MNNFLLMVKPDISTGLTHFLSPNIIHVTSLNPYPDGVDDCL